MIPWSDFFSIIFCGVGMALGTIFAGIATRRLGKVKFWVILFFLSLSALFFSISFREIYGWLKMVGN